MLQPGSSEDKATTVCVQQSRRSDINSQRYWPVVCFGRTVAVQSSMTLDSLFFRTRICIRRKARMYHAHSLAYSGIVSNPSVLLISGIIYCARLRWSVSSQGSFHAVMGKSWSESRASDPNPWRQRFESRVPILKSNPNSFGLNPKYFISNAKSNRNYWEIMLQMCIITPVPSIFW